MSGDLVLILATAVFLVLYAFLASTVRSRFGNNGVFHPILLIGGLGFIGALAFWIAKNFPTQSTVPFLLTLGALGMVHYWYYVRKDR